ncbi:MAG: aldo/keto reductase [Alphaproteobacteria bacterium]
MRQRKLGQSDITVSEICLGSMTWGTQNDYTEASAQINFASERGVNFIDTAELYPTIPLSAETQGDTEAIIGRYMKEKNCRDKFIIATKIGGPGIAHLRSGEKITPTSITKALEGSLKRLQTDYVDLYQLHWPNRGHYHFRKNWNYEPKVCGGCENDNETLEILAALDHHIKAGNIRAIGLSNETAWGTATFLRLAESRGLPRMVSIQNEYSLLCRWFDLDLAELAVNENIGLLSYSPLATGILSGKYLNSAVPKGSRASIKPGLDGRLTQFTDPPVQAYLDIAAQHRLRPEQMALAFCLQRPFIGSVIIGATSLEQLDIALGSSEIKLTKGILDDIQKVYRHYPAPL